MLIIITEKGYNSKVVAFPAEHPFLKISVRDKFSLSERTQQLVDTISPFHRGFSTKESSTVSAVVKTPLPEKLPMKMRVKNTPSTSSELASQILKYSPNWGAFKVVGGKTQSTNKTHLKFK